MIQKLSKVYSLFVTGASSNARRPLWIVKKPIVPSISRVYSKNQRENPLSLKKAEIENMIQSLRMFRNSNCVVLKESGEGRR